VLELAAIRPGEDVLEVATGTGVQLVRLAAANPGGRTVGVEPSAGMLAQSRRRLEAAGLGDRVELIEGDVTEMSPIGSRHAAAVKRATRLFYRVVGGRAVVSVQDPIRLDEHSEPRPDLALLHPRADLHAGAHPGPQDVLLVVEVADTSTAYDRGVKLPLYARAGVPEAWLLVLSEPNQSGGTERRLEVHREPSPQGYRLIRRLQRGERLAPLALPDLDLAIDELLGAAELAE
jgi:Uma2 family endonuclease